MISNKMITDSQDKNLTPALSSREGERGRRIASGRINIETDAEGYAAQRKKGNGGGQGGGTKKPINNRRNRKKIFVIWQLV